MNTQIPFGKLREGKRYRVVFSDCCVSGGFTATLIETKGKEIWDGELNFDNGVFLDTLGQVYFYEFEDES